MDILYTGAATFLEKQEDPSISLGGYISSTSVPNDFLSNLFGEISKLSASQGKRVIRAIAFKNDTASTITSVKVYVAPEDDEPAASFKLGFQVPVLDECGDLVIEQLPNESSSPLNVDMVDATGPGKAIDLPDIEAGKYVGIYIQRILDDDAVTFTDQEVIDEYIAGTSPNTEEVIDLIFSWV